MNVSNMKSIFLKSSISVEEIGQVLDISDVIIHPDYKPWNAHYDVAVVKLKASHGMKKSFFQYC